MTDAAQSPRNIQLLLDCQLAVFHGVARELSAALRAQGGRLLPPTRSDTPPDERRLVERARLAAAAGGERLVAAFERALEMPSRALNKRPTAASTVGAMGTCDTTFASSSLPDDAETTRIMNLLAAKTIDDIDPMQLFALELRVGALLGSAPVDRDTNPVGPHALLRAVHEATAAATADGQARLVLLNALQPRIARALWRAYDEVNIVLSSEGVLPGRRGQPSGAAAPPAPDGDDDLTQGCSGSDTTPVTRDLIGDSGRSLSTERQSVRQRGDRPSAPCLSGSTPQDPAPRQRSSAPGAARASHPVALSLATLMPTIAPPAPADALDTLVRSVLAAGPLTPEAVGILADPAHPAFPLAIETPPDQALLAELGRTQVIRALMVDEPGHELAPLRRACEQIIPPVDVLTGRLVDAVFDFALREGSLTHDARRQIARLQIAAYRAALVDRSFFARRDHPCRAFIDAVVGLAADSATDIGGNAFVSALRDTVDALMSAFADDLSVFSAASETLRKAVDFTAAPSAVFEHAIASLGELETRDAARRRAREEIEARLLPSTPRFLANFLSGPYTDVLAAIPREADGEALWQSRIDLADRLVWSVMPKTPDTAAGLSQALPGLIASVRSALRDSGVPAPTRHAFLEALFVAHHRILRRARSPETERLAAEATAEATALTAHPPLDPMKRIPDARMDAELLQVGTLIECIDEPTLKRGKVLAIGPAGEMCALAHPDGTATHRRYAEIERLIRTGRARVVVPDRGVVERAMAQWLDREAESGTYRQARSLAA